MPAKEQVAVSLRPLNVRTDVRQVVCLGQTALEFPWTENEYVEKLRQWNCPAVVAEIDGKIVAWLIGQREPDHIQLCLMAVRADLTRGGIGRRLVEWLKVYAADNGYELVRLHVRETNLAAQLLLRACGFKAVQVLRQFYPQKQDAFVMECTVECKSERKRAASTPRVIRFDEDGFVD